MNALYEFNRAEAFAVTLAAIVESSDDAIIGKNLDGMITSWNPGAERMFGYAASEMIDGSIMRIIPSDRQAEEEGILAQIARGERVQHFETVRRSKSGRLVDVSVTVSPIKDDGGRVVGASKIARDITERKKTEAELRTTKQQLQLLVGRLDFAREEEAKRIARDLHDDLGQQLTALSMELGLFEQEQSGLTVNARDKFARMTTIVNHTIKSVQKIAANLRLGQLDVFGLTAAIEWQLNEFTRRSAIPCRVTHLDKIDGLSDPQNTAIFRILQETLTNIFRHAGATEVEVSLVGGPEQLTFQVRDNGCGITAADVNSKTAIGLLGMRERANLIGGEVTITGGTGVGTTVLLKLPLKPSMVLQP
jgi:PAS domain S-box-containing protein